VGIGFLGINVGNITTVLAARAHLPISLTQSCGDPRGGSHKLPPLRTLDRRPPPSDLHRALDQVDYGIVVLDGEFQAEFINRAFHRMWALPELSDGASYNFADIVEHGRRTGAYITAPASIEDYVRQRKGRLRLSDGRILKFECKSLPDGGRMMTFADISDLVRTADQLRELAAVDDLTKLPNRRQFLKSLENEFSRAQRHDRPLTVLMIDADDFKLINDRHGHFAGDEVLRTVADRLRGIVRQTDLLGRLGGEEFAVALTETDMPSALETAERLCCEIAVEPFQVAGSRIQVTVSVGVATRRARDDNAAQLLRLADKAMYLAKSGGRNRVLANLDA
jgi:diguanylate cyclase (GGDEF)-like protein